MEYIPKDYFEDEVSKGVARGIIQRSAHSRLTILDMPFGFGKTNIALITAMLFAKMSHNQAQIGIIAPKTKRIDGSFKKAIDSVNHYYDVQIDILPINGQEIGTFSGLSAMYSRVKKTKINAQLGKQKHTNLYEDNQGLIQLVQRYNEYIAQLNDDDTKKIEVRKRAFETSATVLINGYKKLLNERLKLDQLKAQLKILESDGKSTQLEKLKRSLFKTDAQYAERLNKFKSSDLGHTFFELFDNEHSIDPTSDKLLIFGDMLTSYSNSNYEKMQSSEQLTKDRLATFEHNLIQKPTVLVFDETHMSLRDSTSIASKSIKKIFNTAQNSGQSIMGIGLTATPTNNAILDCIGYLVANGTYSSKTNFYEREVKDFNVMQKQGLNQLEIEKSIIDTQNQIHYDKFINSQRVIDNISQIMYVPDSPQNFHIPQNVFQELPISLSADSKTLLDEIHQLDENGAYKDGTTKRLAYINGMTTDINIVKKIVDIVQRNEVVQPLIFYQFNDQRDFLIKYLKENDISFSEINGTSKTFFNTGHSLDEPVLVQYKSGASAFESKQSNTSIYYGLPDSTIDYMQSLGRNARRGQNMEKIINYIIIPCIEDEPIAQFQQMYSNIEDKTKMNSTFINQFKTEWGTFET